MLVNSARTRPRSPAATHTEEKPAFNHSIGLGSRPRLPRRGRHRLPNTTYGRPPDTGGCFLVQKVHEVLSAKCCSQSVVRKVLSAKCCSQSVVRVTRATGIRYAPSPSWLALHWSDGRHHNGARHAFWSKSRSPFCPKTCSSSWEQSLVSPSDRPLSGPP